MKTMHIPNRRFAMMLFGILLVGLSVSFFRLSAFGVDPFTCMNLGVSGFLHLGFGTWQLIVNIALLILVFFTMRSSIGLGTIVNMVCVGYIADFVCWLISDVGGVDFSLPFRVLLLAAGTVVLCAGVAIYMTANMGIAPYDAVAIILQQATHHKLAFRWARILTDVSCVTIGIIFCLLSGENLWLLIGLGTIVAAFLTGPLVQFFTLHLAEPMLHGRAAKQGEN